MLKHITEMSLHDIIGYAIDRARDGQQTRESACVITKLQEASMWNEAYTRELKTAAARAGVGPSIKDSRAQMIGGVMLTEPIDLPETKNG